MSPPPTETDPKYLRPHLAAVHAGVPERMMRRLIEERRIPHYKIGRYVVLNVHELDSWIAEHKREVVE
jgi:excisionase family DNA binding protein